MDYGCVVPARFLDRPNRFVAHVLLGQETVTCHVKNTGRCRELLVPGARVYLARGRNPGRRTAWDLIAADKDVRYEQVINVMKTLQEAKIESVGHALQIEASRR